MPHTASSHLREVHSSDQSGLWYSSITYPSSEIDRRSYREFRIANAILDAARAEAACLGGARLVRIGVAVGQDCDINLAILEDALNLVRHGTDCEGVAIHLTSLPIRSHCHSCDSTFSPVLANQYCPKCKSPDAEMISGDELELAFIEVERS